MMDPRDSCLGQFQSNTSRQVSDACIASDTGAIFVSLFVLVGEVVVSECLIEQRQARFGQYSHFTDQTCHTASM